jgi:hypothetical protein
VVRATLPALQQYRQSSHLGHYVGLELIKGWLSLPSIDETPLISRNR